MTRQSAMSAHDFDAVPAAARLGESWALTALFRAYVGPVAGYVRAHSPAEPDDLVSEVFLSAFTSLDRFTGDEPDLRASTAEGQPPRRAGTGAGRAAPAGSGSARGAPAGRSAGPPRRARAPLADVLRLVCDSLVNGLAAGMPSEHLDGVLDLVEETVRTPPIPSH